MKRSVGRFIAAAIVSLGLIGAAGSGVTGQEAGHAPHPSHIHVGSCAELDPNPAYPLADVGPVSPEAEPGAVEMGASSLDVTLDELLANPFAINVHESAENIANYIACGDIAGPVVDGTLIVGLLEQNDSGYSGVAVLTTTETGGTEVRVYLGEGLTSGAAAAQASPVASPAVASPVADAVPISILDFSFSEESVEVPVGTTVTWTNDGQVIHTTTSKDGLWDSTIMQSGDTFSYTFDTAGTYDYWCSLHPTMLGTIVVTAE